ncbi:hypothetical protein [Planococcus dechangensis]|uniref:Uncharacterized protein n=1 Tax=Planococcus dechangensis TaxID=1176255 RepID=A0ABV9ME80_9BACL
MPELNLTIHGIRRVKPTSPSHFTSQIERQNNWTNNIAIWEMFFYEDVNGSSTKGFNQNGSSCFWNEDANNYIISKRPYFDTNEWKTTDLTNIFTNNGKRKYGKNLQHMIREIVKCNRGELLPVDMTNSVCKVKGKNGEELSIPLPLKNLRNSKHLSNNSYDELSIIEFMEGKGISFYMFWDLDSTNDMRRIII